jgi:uncharacterized iron-regulated membrane protein
MAWLHAWTGLVSGWVLFAIFVTGTTSYYRADISRWMRPELQSSGEVDPGRAADVAIGALTMRASEAQQWFVRLPQKADPTIGVQWRGRGGIRGSLLLDPETGEPVQVRETQGGEFLYRFHFELSLPPIWGRWIVGIATLVMLVALVSGVITHRRIFADFFTFRPTKGGRRAWLDAHNVVGVLALPYYFMIAYSGLVLLSITVMPWGVLSGYQGDTSRFAREFGLLAIGPRPATGHAAPLAPIGPIIAEATRRAGSAPEHLVIDKPRDANATVTVLMEQPHGIAHRHPQIAFDGITGTFLAQTGQVRPAAQTYFFLSGLHQADFATPALRALYTLCGVMGAVMAATGLVLWTRACGLATEKGSRLGLRLVRALNIGTIVGLPIGIAAYFLANRLLPFELDNRAHWEIRAFFCAWMLTAIIPIVVPHASAWRLTLLSAGLAYTAIPCVDAVMVGRGDTTSDMYNVTMLAVGLISLYARLRIARQ